MGKNTTEGIAHTTLSEKFIDKFVGFDSTANEGKSVPQTMLSRLSVMFGSVASPQMCFTPSC